MAKLHEELIVIKLSKLVRANDEVGKIASEEILTTVTKVLEELAGESVVVEVESAQ